MAALANLLLRWLPAKGTPDDESKAVWVSPLRPGWELVERTTPVGFEIRLVHDGTAVHTYNVDAALRHRQSRFVLADLWRLLEEAGAVREKWGTMEPHEVEEALRS